MPFFEHLEPISLGGMDVSDAPNGLFQLSAAISLKRIADLMEQRNRVRSQRVASAAPVVPAAVEKPAATRRKSVRKTA